MRKTSKQRLLIATFVVLSGFISGFGALAMETPGQLLPGSSKLPLTAHQQFARDQLIVTVRLYNDFLRVEETGQYLDKIDMHTLQQASVSSSTASTGVGLISLTIGDRLRVVDNAAEKAITTLESLLNRDPGLGFVTPRSKSGWFKHFINARTGAARNASKNVFSTIDTAILGVGASMVARYFEAKPASDLAAQMAAKRAYELIDSVDWGQAVRFGEIPGVHQVFRGFDEQHENRWWSVPFDEYVILPCLGRAVEARRGVKGPASKFWDAYLSDPARLPQTEVGDLSILAVNGRRVPSHFTHQFAHYFCGDFGFHPSYRAELRELRQADQKWFMTVDDAMLPDHWWGLGAGSEIKFDVITGKIKYSGYGVARIGKNPNLTFSPAIMAGFLGVEEKVSRHDETFGTFKTQYPDKKLLSDVNLPRVPVHSPIINDLIMLHNNNECRYDFAGLDFLWRCSAFDPSLRVRHIEGVDLSTYLLGLAWFDPAVGVPFFHQYSVRARPRENNELFIDASIVLSREGQSP